MEVEQTANLPTPDSYQTVLETAMLPPEVSAALELSSGNPPGGAVQNAKTNEKVNHRLQDNGDLHPSQPNGYASGMSPPLQDKAPDDDDDTSGPMETSSPMTNAHNSSLNTRDHSVLLKQNVESKNVTSTGSSSGGGAMITAQGAVAAHMSADDTYKCGECTQDFSSLKAYMDHTCSLTNNSNKDELMNDDDDGDDEEEMMEEDEVLSDVESFDGKIVYNPDGSAYIIEGDSDLSETESLLDVPQLEGSIVEQRGKVPTSQIPSYPQIENAFYIQRNPATFYNPFYVLPESKPRTEAPIMHSYRVYDVRTKGKKDDNSDSDCSNDESGAKTSSLKAKLPIREATTVPTKPILMCFICKLSFGFAKSFVAHAVGEHSMELNEEERNIMSQKNASAIIQGVGKDKYPLMSFLEPSAAKQDSEEDTSAKLPNSFSPTSSAIPLFNSNMTGNSNTSVSYMCKNVKSAAYEHSSPKGAYTATAPTLNNSEVPSNVSSAVAEQNKGSNPMLAQELINQGAIYSGPQKSPAVSEQPTSAFLGSQHMTTNASIIIKQENPYRMDENARDCTPQRSPGRASPGRASPGRASEGLGTRSPTSSSSSSSPRGSSPRPAGAGLLSPSSTASPLHGYISATCEDHPQGNHGVECPKCDMFLGSSRSLGGHMTMMHSRNSCKTLKCPKCNWHYKYQETLEIHMKEKHPENEAQCIYCLTSQPHPRLARGEIYTCGYKPYRCDVCNYSTTTKGNLSIHMQSDKHINNIQELQNGSTEMKMPPTPPLPPDNSNVKKNKPKPTWRCDVCNYETNVARNLRIHMTSEKHTHNMMVLQQNVKHMQRDMQFQLNQMAMFGQDPAMMGLPSPLNASNMPAIPYDQSLFSLPLPSNLESPVDLSKEQDVIPPPEINLPADLKNNNASDPSKIFQCSVCNVYSTDSIEALHQHMQVDRTKQGDTDNISVANGSYLCNLCKYKTNLKANFQLHCKTDKHLQRLQVVNHIRDGGHANEWRLKYMNLSNPVQVKCNACDYYTNSIHKLQLHTTNSRHETSSKLFHHLQASESKLSAEVKYYHCSLCNYSTKAKLNLIQHVRSMKHMRNESMRQMQCKEQGLDQQDIQAIFSVKEYHDTDSIVFEEGDGDQEVDSDPNPEEGSSPEMTLMTESMADLPGTSDRSSSQDQIHVCPYCNYSNASEMQIRTHVLSQHSQRPREYLCPLCQENFNEKVKLEHHLVQVHNVTTEGMQRLLVMVDTPEWLSPQSANTQSSPTSSASATPDDIMPTGEAIKATDLAESELARLANDDGSQDGIVVNDKGDVEDIYRCQTCSKTFQNIDGLYAHQNELGHLELKQTPRGPGYLCWKKGCNQYFKTAQALQVHFREIHAKRQQLAVSERHVYKYRCNQCSLAFKTLDKLQLHSQYHIIRAATKCTLCGRSFRTIQALRKHIESTHLETMTADELDAYQKSLQINPFGLFGMESLGASGVEPKEGAEVPGAEAKITNNDEALTAQGSSTPEPSQGALAGDDSESTQDSTQTGEGEAMDTTEGLDGIYKEQQFFEDYINSQAMAEDSYNDPTRKYKCHRCKVAFTKQNYLTAHNKTLLHRKGDKLSYPMEKYLDPNRPYKCDVCKESFTQKNILLVHYNSVSHLHKLKQVGQQSGANPSISSPSTTSTPSTPTNSVTAGSTTPTPTGSAPSASPTPTNETEKKPYKCNICKVSYSQGSTLDIHMRSVLHQTRASKIQELVQQGQIDLNMPLVEQPDMPAPAPSPVSQPQQQQHQQKKILAEMLQSKQHLPPMMPPSPIGQQSPLIFSSMGHTPTPPHTPIPASTPSNPEIVMSTSTPKPAPSPSASKTPISESATISSQAQNMYICQRCNSIFSNHETLVQHQQMFCYFQMSTPSSNSSQGMPPIPNMRQRGYPRFKAQVHRNLLENFGFECVMQFNEFNQKVKKPKENTEDVNKLDSNNIKEETKENGEIAIKIKEEKMDTDTKEEERKPLADLPEINKCLCTTCKKEFSSIWVLKAHQEEVHRELVSVDLVEEYGEKFRDAFEKKQPAPPSEILEVSVDSVPATPSEPPKSTPSSVEVKMEPPTPNSALENAMAASQMMQMPGLFGMMPMQIGMNMPLSMNMHPPLMPMMIPPENMFMPPGMPLVDSSFMAAQKQQQVNQQKRARTRINDEQLKILRAHFDINNSPSEEQIMVMSDKSGLPTKVIKHWFRNTLFKERQRNKDSPYNFNNPPSTSINLEEYEKTGKIPLTSEEEAVLLMKEQAAQGLQMHMSRNPNSLLSPHPVVHNPHITHSTPLHASIPHPSMPDTKDHQDNADKDSNTSCSESIASMSSAPPTPTTPAFHDMTPTSSVHHMTSDPGTPSNQSTPCSTPSASCGKRANRTRFTDYQLKLLQEYFDQNAYPKDDDLDHLSKLLNLSPRVIVVWFQNARQKARKVYENQPPVDMTEEGSGNRYQRTPGLNYQCKKCLTVFQRYYELIKHQKKHCFKEDNESNSSSIRFNNETYSDSENEEKDLKINTNINNNSQIKTPEKAAEPKIKEEVTEKETKSSEANFKCDKCNLMFSRFDLWREHQKVHLMNPNLFPSYPADSAFAMLQNVAHAQQQNAAHQLKQQQQQHQQQLDRSVASNDEMSPSKRKLSEEDEDEYGDQPRDKRLRTTILPEQLDYLYQKYQIDCNPSRKQLENIAAEVGLKKRVVQVWFQNTRARERKGQYRAHQQLIHKRCPFCRALFRARSALESHLATKHSEEMAKGDINVDSIPDAAAESLLPTSSSASTPSVPGLDMAKLLSNPFNMQQFMPPLIPGGMAGMGFPQANDPIQAQMKRFYEDSLKKYLDELSGASHMPKIAGYDIPVSATPPSSTKSSSSATNSSSSKPATVTKAEADEDGPLDLSKPIKVNTDHHERHAEGPSTDVSERSGGSYGIDDHNRSNSYFMDDSRSETYSESTENNDLDDSMNSNPTSPNSKMSLSMQNTKRYRTQMTSVQVKIMKNLFTDYKTPTMAECEMLGRDIGLPKRVVQVWFQNARAKEKKSKLAYQKAFGTDVDFSRPPEKCKMCNFKYSHKYTIQDHIFTKKHIDNVRKVIQSQSESDREFDPSVIRQQLSAQSAASDEHKMWDVKDMAALSQHPHLAHLHAMGMQAMGLPANPLSGLNSSSAVAGLADPGKKEAKQTKETTSSASNETKVKQEPKKDSGNQDSGSKKKELMSSDSTTAASMMSPFANMIPGMPDMSAGFLPFMYPGLGGFYPGMGMGMPFMQPSFLPGPENMFAYDPTIFGTPLTLLQIPQEAITKVQAKLGDSHSTLAQYTQDCRSLDHLKEVLSAEDVACVQKSSVDVGFICKKCHMVYPGRDACVSHQQTLCYNQVKTNKDSKSILKLEQVQFDCSVCHDKCSTVQEFKVHCNLDRHKLKRNKATGGGSATSAAMIKNVLAQQGSSSGVTAPKTDNLPPHDNNAWVQSKTGSDSNTSVDGNSEPDAKRQKTEQSE